jgi:TetR/AcrR family transcriptional regulator, regulator of autoinduction and epiphytic fitness
VSSAAAAPDAPLTDGRILRAERTRRLVVEALLDLVQAGELHPTAQQVSDRSGVSMRSIFRLFQDVDALHSAAIAAQLERVAHLFEAPDAAGPVESRLAALVAQRTRLYETIAPVRRMALRLAPRSHPIAAELARANAILHEQLAELFAPELAAMLPGRRAEVIEALDALTSWETWERLRAPQGLEAGEAARIVTTTALSVLR